MSYYIAQTSGGALYAEKNSLTLGRNNCTFTATTTIVNNTGEYGGGINTRHSFAGPTIFCYNHATVGGAIYTLHAIIVSFSADTQFIHNRADTNGGAIYAIGTNITVGNLVTASFELNSAQNGAAVYLKTTATITLNTQLNP